jgi:hypothetical protein
LGLLPWTVLEGRPLGIVQLAAAQLARLPGSSASLDFHGTEMA